MIRTLIALSLMLGFTAFAIFSNYAAMLMYWWFGIFRPHEWMWWDLSVLKLPTIAAALFFIPSLINGHNPLWKDTLCVLMFLVLAQMFLSTQLMGCAGSILDVVNTRTLKVGVVLIVASLLSARICKTPTMMLGWMMVVVVSLSTLNAKIGLAALIGSETLYDAKLGGGSFAGSNSASMGSVMSLMITLFLLQILVFKSKVYFPRVKFQSFFLLVMRGLLCVIALGMVAFIYGTESRGSALALVLAGSVWMLLHKRRLRVLLAASLVVIVVVGTVGIPEEYVDRITSAFAQEEERDNSIASRPHFWEAATAMANDNPMGVGLGCYKAYYDFYDSSLGKYGTQRSVHSSHFSILAELGYPGLVLWVLLFLVSFWKMFKIRHRWAKYTEREKHGYYFYYFANAFIALQVGFLFGGSFYELWLNDITWMVFGMVIAIERFSNVEYEIVKARERMLQADLTA